MKNRVKQFLNKKVIAAKCRVANKLAENNGQFVMDHSVVFVLIIVLGGIALGLLTTFLTTDLAPTLKTKILDFFN